MRKESFNVWDAASLIVGIVVGTAIFKSPSLVFDNVTSPSWGMSMWLVGGILSLLGAYCYAELATTYRKSGGDYHYISVAFGSFPAFLFACVTTLNITEWLQIQAATQQRIMTSLALTPY